MKRFLIILMLSFTILVVRAQSGDIYISVATPQNCLLDSNAKTLLKNKILNAVAENGVAATECSALAFVPEICIMEEDKVEGGMRTIYTRKLSITITARNIITNTVFGSVQLTSNGEGYSMNDANRSAINKINMQTELYRSFVEETKRKVIDYYDKNTSSLIAKANSLATQQEYDEALALLSTYPETLSGYPKVSVAISEIFKKSQTKYCSEIMQAARAAYAQRDFAGAAEIAASINSGSSCASEAKQFLAQVKRDSDREYNDQLAMEREKNRNQVALERERIRSNERVHTATTNAAKEIAKAYYQRQTRYVYFW